MLEGNMLDYPTTLASQADPATTPTHNGFALAVRGVRFCGANMKIANNTATTLSPINKSECINKPRPIIPQQTRANIVKSAPVAQRRRSSNATNPGGRKTLLTTPIPADVTSELTKSNPSAADRLKFSDRLNALLRTGTNTSLHDFDDEKDPYAFVDSADKHQKLQQTGVVPILRKIPTPTPQSKAKKRKINSIQQQQPGIKPTITKQTNIVKLPQQIITTSNNTSVNISGTSLLKNVKFTEINSRLQQEKITQPNSIISAPTQVTKMPVTLPNHVIPQIPNHQSPPPLVRTISSEEKTTMNQLQAKIARNKVIGKHRNKVSSHSQTIVANPSNVISSQQLSKFKEKSLLEEQLLKNEKLKHVQIKTVTQHFTFPAKNSGAVVTYKKPVTHADMGILPGMVTLASKKSKKMVIKLPNTTVEASRLQLQRIEEIRVEAKAYRQDLFPLGLEESDSGDDTDQEEGVAFQRHWFLPSQDDVITCRESRLRSVKATLRRRYLQLRRSEAHCLSPSVGTRPGSPDTPAVRALICAARNQPNRTAALLLSREEETNNSPLALLARARRNKHRPRNELLSQTKCCYADCTATSLPCTRHCIKHVMYNVDQLLFEHCTAKFADNTQCCVPVFDIMHELPLCLEHARKRDNYQKQDSRPKKARRKAKPSAMTRPSKRGKKKRKGGSTPTVPNHIPVQQQIVAQQTIPVPQQHIIQQHVIQQQQHLQAVIKLDTQQQQQIYQQHPVQDSPPAMIETMVPMMMTEDSLSQSQPDTGSMMADNPGCSDSDNDMAGLLQEVEAQAEALSPGTMLSDELPLETAEELAQQASRLLEEHDDLTSVLYQIPADTLNELFNGEFMKGEKTGEYEPTREETEELERALAAVDKDVKSLEKMSRQQNGPSSNANTSTNILPSELVDSILGPHLVDDHTLSLALRHHQGCVAKEVVVDGTMMAGQHSQMLGQQGLNIADTTANGFSNDLHTQLLPSQDSMIQLDAAVFPPDAMLDMQGQTYMLHQSGGTLHQNMLTSNTSQQNISFPSNDVSLMHHNLLPQMPLITEQLLNPAVYGGGAAPPPTPHSVHQPAVANTPPFHPHQNGYLINQQHYDAKSSVVFAPPAQFSPSTPTNSMLNITSQAQGES